MKRLVLVGAIAALGALACGPGTRGLWFEGGFEEAVSEAESRETLALLEFYTDWCTWCGRLEADTFSDPRVRDELRSVVAMKVNAEKGGTELARRFEVDGYPTIVFVDALGEEVDRIIGYLPPDRFVEEVRRIRAGDTFAVCLDRLNADPEDLDALRRAVRGFLERSDPEAAIARIEHFHSVVKGEGPEDPCAPLMFEARITLQDRVYQRVEKALAGGDTLTEVGNGSSAPFLQELIDGDLSELDAGHLREKMRNARYEDAGRVLAAVSFDQLDDEGLWQGASFAFGAGRYEAAAEMYLRWVGREGTSRSADALNVAAWNLYLSKREIGAAVKMARRAYEEKPSHSITDTLARLLYISGEQAGAMQLMGQALAIAEGRDAARYEEALEIMRVAGDLGDIPPFETYPLM